MMNVNPGTVRELAAACVNLNPKDKEFALSLVNQFNRKGDLSPKQAPWVDTLLSRANATKKDESPATARSIATAAIVRLFESSTAKRKRIVFRADDGTDIRLSYGGDYSKYPGAVHMSSNEKSFDDRKYFGRIDPDGTVVSKYANKAIHDAVEKFAASPVEMIIQYGRLSNSCSFCSRQLDNPRSIELGYGPVCASKYNLEY